MIAEIIFKDSCRPLEIEVEDIYTKGGLLCLQLPGGMIRRYPIGIIWSITSPHQCHIGSTRKNHDDPSPST